MPTTYSFRCDDLEDQLIQRYKLEKGFESDSAFFRFLVNNFDKQLWLNQTLELKDLKSQVLKQGQELHSCLILLRRILSDTKIKRRGPDKKQ